MGSEKFCSDKAVVLGGILLGDCFRLNMWLQQISNGEPLVAFSSLYDSEVIEVFIHDTDVPIVQNFILKEAKMTHYSWKDFEEFVEIFESTGYRDQFSEISIPTIEDLHHKLQPMNYTSPGYNIFLPDEPYMVCQCSSHFGFKDRQSLYHAFLWNYLPVVNIGGPDDTNNIRGSQVENGRPLRESCQIISGAKLFVGIDSWASQFAAQIFVPSAKLHFGSWEFTSRGVKELGGVDLYQPSATQIEETIEKSLKIIDAATSVGERFDLSGLSIQPPPEAYE